MGDELQAAKKRMLVGLSKMPKPVLFPSVKMWGRSIDLERLNNIHIKQDSKKNNEFGNLSGLTSRSEEACSSKQDQSDGSGRGNTCEDKELQTTLEEIYDIGKEAGRQIELVESSTVLRSVVDSNISHVSTNTAGRSFVDSKTNLDIHSDESVLTLGVRERVLSSVDEEAAAPQVKSDRKSSERASQEKSETSGSPQFGGSCWQRMCLRKSK